MLPIFVEGIEHPPLGAVMNTVKWLVKDKDLKIELSSVISKGLLLLSL